MTDKEHCPRWRTASSRCRVCVTTPLSIMSPCTTCYSSLSQHSRMQLERTHIRRRIVTGGLRKGYRIILPAGNFPTPPYCERRCRLLGFHGSVDNPPTLLRHSTGSNGDAVRSREWWSATTHIPLCFSYGLGANLLELHACHESTSQPCVNTPQHIALW